MSKMLQWTKIVLVVDGNRNFDLIRFRAKIAIFDFESNIETKLLFVLISNFWFAVFLQPTLKMFFSGK